MVNSFRVIIILGLLFFQGAQALVDHKLLKRVAVFPIADANFSSSEDAWWQIREELTRDERFLVASRRFLINRGVFQPRKELKPADAIILGKILDAEALVVSYVKERQLEMKVYEGENGYLLWEGSVEFHPAIPMKDQMLKVTLQLIRAFLAAIPYQGFMVKHPSTSELIVEDQEKQWARVNIGKNSEIQLGDVAQWVWVRGDVSAAYFSESGARVEVFAEGIVRGLRDDVAVIEVTKMTRVEDLIEHSLVRFPRESKRLADLASGNEKDSKLSAEYLSTELRPAEELKQGHHKTSSALMWIVNAAAFILLAF